MTICIEFRQFCLEFDIVGPDPRIAQKPNVDEEDFTLLP